MRYRHLAAQAALTVAVLVGANLAVRRLAADSIPRRLMRVSERAGPVTDLFLGNSLIDFGVNPDAFAAAAPGRRPLNLGMASSAPVEHYLLYREHARHHPPEEWPGAAVYYGFSNAALTDPPQGDWGTLIGNRAVGYYVEPELAFGFYAPDSPARAALYRLAARLPALVERYAVWAKVERLRRTLGALGLPPVRSNGIGRVEDFALVEGDPAAFARRVGRAAAAGTPLTPPLAALFREARGRGWAVVVVEMPMSRRHRQNYYDTPEWRAYRAHAAGLVAAAGGTYVPAAEWAADGDFADDVHLSPAGAAAFSQRLARWAAPPR